MTTLAEKRWNGWRITRWSAAAILLLIPLAMMQVSDGWNWSVGDFVFAAAMIGGTGLLYEWAVSRSGSFAYRAGAALALGGCFLIVWINLAVGIVGDEGNPVNLSFFGLVAMAAAGAFIAEWRARGMARAMLCVAATQALLGAIVATGGPEAHEPPGPIGLLAFNGAFALLWLTCAALFHKAEREADKVTQT
jgi:hypothetical protein